jgi:UDP-3-O-acyl N-acetylglucosamine deacetylase
VKITFYRFQQTIARSSEVAGIGYLTGADVRLRFVPAPEDTGVVFVRTDLGRDVRIPARVDMVTGTERRTTLGKPPASVGLVEHVLAALSGLHIDNCYVEVNAPEPPGLDGSARGFVDALRKAGIELQRAPRGAISVASSLVLHSERATLALHPAEERRLRISYLLDYGVFSPIVRQIHTESILPQDFTDHLAPCRTFLLEEEALELKRRGLGKRTDVKDLLVFGKSGPIDNRLRFGNEPARHKVLDIVGDTSLLGYDIHGHIVAYRAGHAMNVELVRTLAQQMVHKAAA